MREGNSSSLGRGSQGVSNPNTGHPPASPPWRINNPSQPASQDPLRMADLRSFLQQAGSAGAAGIGMKVMLLLPGQGREDEMRWEASDQTSQVQEVRTGT